MNRYSNRKMKTMIEVKMSLIKKVAEAEGVTESFIKEGLSSGRIVIPVNNKREGIAKPCGVGKGLTTKINANIGLSPDNSNMDLEIEKMDMAVRTGADALMDLSTGPNLNDLRRKILEDCPIPVGTVPVYELACMPGKTFVDMTDEDFLDVLRSQAEEGVDFFTIHAGITRDVLKVLKTKPRIINIVSRGGALLAKWMNKTGKENPFYSRFDDVLEICKKYNVTISLGDSLRPGAIGDATDELQIKELVILGELQQRCLKAGVQVMIEGPGHVPLDQIEVNVKLQKTICHDAPFYVLGPLVTDAAPGYDHIVSAIGGAIAASHGADFLCYVTPAEHLRLPDAEDVRQGVMASKIAAHAGDIVKKVPSALKRDMEISKARAKRDWPAQFKLALDTELPEKVRNTSKPKEEDICTMCAEYCSIKIAEDTL